MKTTIGNSIKYWKRLVDYLTIVWFCCLILGFMINTDNNLFFRILLSCIYIAFLIDVFLTLWELKSIRRFLKENWFDILTLIPVFRLFKFLRILKIGKLNRTIRFITKSKKLKKTYNVATDTIDFSNQMLKKK